MRVFLPLVIVAGLVLSACSSGNPKFEGFDSIVPDAIKGVLKRKNKNPAVNPLAGITRAQLKDIPGPLLFANLEKPKAYASLGLIGENNGVQTFVTADKISLSSRGGVVLATRGLGGDLISADVSGTVAAIRKQGGTNYSRIMRWLDGQDVTQTSVFTCSMTNAGRENIEILGAPYATIRLKEKCKSGGTEFENDYWRAPDSHLIWQSRQWLGLGGSYINLQLWVK